MLLLFSLTLQLHVQNINFTAPLYTYEKSLVSTKKS